MTTIVTLTSKRQITLPKVLLDLLGVGSSAKFIARSHDGQITLEPVRHSLAQLQGSLAQTKVGKTHSLEKVLEIAKRRESARLMKQEEE